MKIESIEIIPVSDLAPVTIADLGCDDTIQDQFRVRSVVSFSEIQDKLIICFYADQKFIDSPAAIAAHIQFNAEEELKKKLSITSERQA